MRYPKNHLESLFKEHYEFNHLGKKSVKPKKNQILQGKTNIQHNRKFKIFQLNYQNLNFQSFS